MIATVLGISAGSPPVERMTRNSPIRSMVAVTRIVTGGSMGISPSPCQVPISGSNPCIAKAYLGRDDRGGSDPVSQHAGMLGR